MSSTTDRPGATASDVGAADCERLRVAPAPEPRSTTEPARLLGPILTVLTGAWAWSCASPAPAPAAPAAPEVGELERVAVVGASASAGFLLATDLGQALDLAIQVGHEPARGFAEPWMFTNPRRLGSGQVDAALAFDPTLVIAIDFLFWYGYGHVGDGDARLALLEEGLAQLERFECPVVVGGFPDMSASVGKMLRANQMPSPEALARLERRTLEWAAGRPDVLHVSLAGMLAELEAGEPMEIGGHTWPPDGEVDLLQWDDLHPTLAGQVALAARILESVAAARPGVSLETLDLDPARVYAALEALSAASAQERRKRRAAR